MNSHMCLLDVSLLLKYISDTVGAGYLETCARYVHLSFFFFLETEYLYV